MQVLLMNGKVQQWWTAISPTLTKFLNIRGEVRLIKVVIKALVPRQSCISVLGMSACISVLGVSACISVLGVSACISVLGVSACISVLGVSACISVLGVSACISVLGVSAYFSFYDFLLEFRNVPTVWYFFLFSLYSSTFLRKYP